MKNQLNCGYSKDFKIEIPSALSHDLSLIKFGEFFLLAINEVAFFAQFEHGTGKAS